jgi:hypothetical protein
MPHGGARPNGGRPKGSKNKATILREMGVAAEIDRARAEGRELPSAALERFMRLAEATCLANRPTDTGKGDWGKFGEWFDRAVYCTKELARYREPPIKAVEAPAPPPDPKDLDQKSRRRFGLRVFEGGRALEPSAA